MVVGNTFLNAQMGQIVHYNQVGNYASRPRILKWIDEKDKDKIGVVGADPPPKAA